MTSPFSLWCTAWGSGADKFNLSTTAAGAQVSGMTLVAFFNKVYTPPNPPAPQPAPAPPAPQVDPEG